jgi:hypothetical protein
MMTKLKPYAAVPAMILWVLLVWVENLLGLRVEPGPLGIYSTLFGLATGLTAFGIVAAVFTLWSFLSRRSQG